LRNGPCPRGFESTVPFSVNSVSEMEPVKVNLELAVTEQTNNLGKMKGIFFVLQRETGWMVTLF
jgi:hypothetical protein